MQRERVKEAPPPQINRKKVPKLFPICNHVLSNLENRFILPRRLSFSLPPHLSVSCLVASLWGLDMKGKDQVSDRGSLFKSKCGLGGTQDPSLGQQGGLDSFQGATSTNSGRLARRGSFLH